MKVDLMLNPVTVTLMPSGTHESPAKTLNILRCNQSGIPPLKPNLGFHVL